jgi:hypothetical protein
MKDKIEKNARWHLTWMTQYWKGLLDFNFDKYFIYQMLPMVYGTLLVGIAAAILYFVLETFIAGHIFRGLLYLFVAGPFSFLVIASVIRATIELYMVIFRIAEDVDELLGVRDTLDKLSGLGDAVDQMSAVTSHIPFFKKLSDRKISSDKEKKSRQEADSGSNSQGASDNAPPREPD